MVEITIQSAAGAAAALRGVSEWARTEPAGLDRGALRVAVRFAEDALEEYRARRHEESRAAGR